MASYDDTFVDRFLEPWNRHDVDGALAKRVLGMTLRRTTCHARWNPDFTQELPRKLLPTRANAPQKRRREGDSL
jgi:hypothetical protein